MRNAALVTTGILWGAAMLSGAAAVGGGAADADARAQAPAIEPALPRLPKPSAAPSAATPRALVDQYCVSCHNDRLKSGDLSLAQLDMARLPEHADVWEKVVRKVRAGVMPPQGSRRPEPAALTALVSWIEDGLDREALARPDPGRPMLHRLNRAEYQNAIRDLLALDVDVASLLPPDD